MDPQNREFLELLDRAKSAGWNQSEVARKIGLHRANISQYKKGVSRPSDQTLNLFKRILVDEKPELFPGTAKYPPQSERIAGMDAPEVAAAADELRELHSNDPAKFRAAANVIKELNSAVTYARQRVVKNVASKVKRVSPESSLKPKADARSGEK